MNAIIASLKDPAGMLIRKKLIENFGFGEKYGEFDGSRVFGWGNFRLFTIKEDQIFADYADGIEAELLIFASRHFSKTGPKTLTVHAPGNWGKAEYGGREKTLCPTYASAIKNYLLALDEKAKEMKLEHEVVLEQTHHGPLLSKPAVFIELGSRPEHYGDEKAAELIAEVIIGETRFGKCRAGIGIGGKHYNSEFTKLLLRADYALGHMCPEYALKDLNKEMLEQAYAKTKEKVECIVLDYKGIGSGEEKQRVKRLAEDFAKEKGIEVIRARNVLGKLKEIK